MALTPESGSQPYCTPARFLQFYDHRQVGQLVRDDDGEATAAELLTDGALAAALAAASGDVETATMAGRRFAVADLQALAGNGAARLAQIVADLAYGRLLRRRGVADSPPPQVAEAEDALDALRSGQRILPFAESADAGSARVARITPFDRMGQNLLSDHLDRSMGSRLAQGCWGYGGYGGGIRGDRP